MSTAADWIIPLYPKIKNKKQTAARKNYTCEMCGNEIHKNELMWWYKPRPIYLGPNHPKIYFKWRKRSFDCEPMSYAELEEINAREAREGCY